MPRKEHCLSGEWELLRDRQFNAQIVSIHTGSMAENEWYEMKLAETQASPGLKELPASIGKLEQLEFLDISLCEGLEKLPEEIGQLKKLKEFDMKECYHLRRLPESVCGLSSLKHVICNENIGEKWLRAKASSIPDLRVEIVEAQFTFLTLTF
ncbi:hypothetical protein SUGI_0360270 [Cryptomeria japonica]|nr:hypothetical protein SUGI_0360270 [Cryptomeria japonica]